MLCDRNCHKSILHSLIMTGATPIYLVPSRNGLGIIGPISREQFTPESIRQKVAASPLAKETNGKVRLMVMTNSTYDGLCYNVDAIKQLLGDTVEVLHFDEAWYAYANFHEFYDGYHGISSARPARSPHAITFATQSTHKLLAALSQSSMIHVQHSEKQRLDMARFNEAFMMHTSTSPQYGIIASCDVAAAMMEQPAGRALVQETIDEALSFRRAMTAVKKQMKDSWWFDVWQPEAMAEQPADDRAHWVLQTRRSMAWVRGTCRESRPRRSDQGDHPDAWLVRERQHAAARHTGGGGDEVSVVPAHRDRKDRSLLLPRVVLDGDHQGQVEHARHRAHQLQGLYDANAPLRRVLPALVEAHPAAYAKMGLKDLCEQVHQVYREDNLPKAQKDMYTTLPEMAMRPADAYESLVRGRVESVEIDKLTGRTLAVMLVPYPPGIPLIMPGERITAATKSIHDYLLYARDFDRKFPGFETDIHGLRFEPAADGRRYLVDCVARGSDK